MFWGFEKAESTDNPKCELFCQLSAWTSVVLNFAVHLCWRSAVEPCQVVIRAGTPVALDHCYQLQPGQLRTPSSSNYTFAISLIIGFRTPYHDSQALLEIVCVQWTTATASTLSKVVFAAFLWLHQQKLVI